jgi:hypothetical protein
MPQRQRTRTSEGTAGENVTVGTGTDVDEHFDRFDNTILLFSRYIIAFISWVNIFVDFN